MVDILREPTITREPTKVPDDFYLPNDHPDKVDKEGNRFYHKYNSELDEFEHSQPPLSSTLFAKDCRKRLYGGKK